MIFDPIPTNNEPSPKISLEEIEKYRIRPSDEIPKPDVVMAISGKIISTRKNIFGITGKAKVGKSFLMALLNAAVLRKGEYGVISSYLPKGKDKIIYIDTEQSDYHVSLALKRIKDMVEDYKIDNLIMYAFDAVPTDTRRAYTDFLINNTEGVGLAIIDGIADLVKSVNDEIVAADMVDSLRRWATVNDIAIGYVLHQNPSENSKMRGHLGTVLMNKSETVIQITSTKENDSIKMVETTQTRNAKPDDWSFEIIDGMPCVMDEVYQVPTTGRKVIPALSNIDKYSILIEVFLGSDPAKGISPTILKESIIEKYTEKYVPLADTKAKEFMKFCKEKNWLVQPDGERKNYFLYEFSQD